MMSYYVLHFLSLQTRSFPDNYITMPTDINTGVVEGTTTDVALL